MKSKKQKTVIIALSGGVDSAVSALLLKQQGYKVIAAFMKNFSSSKDYLTGECSWRKDLREAQKIASLLAIPLHIFNFEKQYKSQVIRPMFKSYAKGLTPNPDISCNAIIKFPLFWKKAKKEFNADYIAFGHYAKIKKTKKGFQLLAGKDKSKDQSYFLSELTQKDLEHTLFPIGSLKKEQVRKLAKKHSFPNWNRQGTRGICFVGKVNMLSFLKNKIKSKPGKVKDPNNNIIGTHPGIQYFTIGQRIGPHLNIQITKPSGSEQKKYYIASKLKNNTLVIAPEDHLLLKKKSVFLKSLHLINPKEKIPHSLKARIRNLGQLHEGNLAKINNHYVFTFNKPVSSIAPGQFLVIYCKDKVIASGEIFKAC